VSRRVRVSAKSYGASANYALFGVSSGIINGTASDVEGDVGTNGTLLFNGTPDVYGSVIANTFTLNGNPTIHYQAGYFNGTSGSGYYGYDDAWAEENAR
jgi:hypothetical protein